MKYSEHTTPDLKEHSPNHPTVYLQKTRQIYLYKHRGAVG